jgi:outer membrane lipoprotein-sorting protein
MKHLFTACCFLSLVCPAAFLRAESAAAILSRMDQAAPNFQAMSANIQLTTWVAIIGDKTVEDGTLVMQRVRKDGSVRAILDFSHQKDASANRVIAILGNIVRMVYPNAKTYQDIDVGKKSDALQQFLLLGFGSSGKELAQSYDVTVEGAENVGGQDTTKLLLVPKTASIKNKLLKIEMWIPANAAYPIQQRFYEPADNYRIAAYRAINLKPDIKGKQLDFKPPKDFKKSS